MVRSLRVVLLVVSVAGCSRREEPAPQASPLAEPAVAKGIAYLVERQSAEGAWRSDGYATFRDGTALTPLVLGALLDAADAGFDTTESAAARKRAAAWLAKFAQPDGTIDPGPDGLEYPVYTAALSVQALSHPECVEHRSARDAWVKFLQERQLTEELGWNPDDKPYGGWGYCRVRPRKPQPGAFAPPLVESNLSATVFALAALHAAAALDATTANRAAVFVRRCQNADGGFHFIYDDPVRNKAGVQALEPLRFHSYGSTTADGLRALMLCGLAAHAEERQAAQRWLSTHFRADTHPGVYVPTHEPNREAVYYYYVASVAQALRDRLIASAEAGDWATALTAELIRRQRSDGSWANPVELIRENEPLVATSYAVSALAKTARANPLVVAHRLGHEGANLASQLRHVTQVVGVQAVGQENHGCLGTRVDPDGCSGEAGVAVSRAFGEGIAAGSRVAGLHVPAERAFAHRVAAFGGNGNVVRLGEPLHGLFGENPFSLQFAAAQQHAAVAGQIVGSGEQPGMPGHAAEVVSPGVVDFAPNAVAVAQSSRGDSPQQAFLWHEGGVRHLQRFKEVLASKAVEGQTAEVFDQLSKHNEADIAIAKAGAGRGFELQPGDPFQRPGWPIRIVGQRVVGRQARGVQEQVFNGYRLLVVGSKGGPVLRHGIGELELALLDQQPDGSCCGDGFGERSQVEQSIGRHGLRLGFQGAEAIGLAEHDRVGVNNEHDGSRAIAALQSGFNGRVDLGQLLRVGFRGAGCTTQTEKPGEGEQNGSQHGGVRVRGMGLVLAASGDRIQQALHFPLGVGVAGPASGGDALVQQVAGFGQTIQTDQCLPRLQECRDVRVVGRARNQVAQHTHTGFVVADAGVFHGQAVPQKGVVGVIGEQGFNLCHSWGSCHL